MPPRGARTLTLHYITPTSGGRPLAPAQAALLIARPASKDGAASPAGTTSTAAPDSPDRPGDSPSVRSVTVSRAGFTVASTLGRAGGTGPVALPPPLQGLPTPAALWRAATAARTTNSAPATPASPATAGSAPASPGAPAHRDAADPATTPSQDGKPWARERTTGERASLGTSPPVRTRHDRTRTTRPTPAISDGVLHVPAPQATTSHPAAPPAPAQQRPLVPGTVPMIIYPDTVLPSNPNGSSDAAGPGSRDTITPMSLPDEDDSW